MLLGVSKRVIQELGNTLTKIAGNATGFCCEEMLPLFLLWLWLPIFVSRGGLPARAVRRNVLSQGYFHVRPALALWVFRRKDYIQKSLDHVKHPCAPG